MSPSIASVPRFALAFNPDRRGTAGFVLGRVGPVGQVGSDGPGAECERRSLFVWEGRAAQAMAAGARQILPRLRWRLGRTPLLAFALRVLSRRRLRSRLMWVRAFQPGGGRGWGAAGAPRAER